MEILGFGVEEVFVVHCFCAVLFRILRVADQRCKLCKCCILPGVFKCMADGFLSACKVLRNIAVLVINLNAVSAVLIHTVVGRVLHCVVKRFNIEIPKALYVAFGNHNVCRVAEH